MKLEDINPWGNYSVIIPFESATESDSGLAIQNTSNATAAPCRGTVLKSGPESKTLSGMDILFIRYSAYTPKVMTSEGEKEIMIVQDDDILGDIKGRKLPKKSKKQNAVKKS